MISRSGSPPRFTRDDAFVRLTLVRNATVIVEIAGRRLLVGAMLDDAGARPPIANTANQVPNPTVPLPFPAEEVVHGLDAVLVTHRHRGHLDARGEELTPRGIPVFCQPEDEEALRDLGLDARPVASELTWRGVRIVRTPARHGSGAVAEDLAPVSGFLLDDLYLAGDTVWYDAVETTRDVLRAALPGVLVPEDGATLEL
jgi:L-ascorbate metabolism protein UlaG (beta-lactamase superfamily)